MMSPTGTTETTMLPCSCPTEETTYTADTTKPTEEITQCPTDVTCPDVTCPDVTCPEVTGMGVTCPDATSVTEPTILPCTCTTEETTLISDKPNQQRKPHSLQVQPNQQKKAHTIQRKALSLQQ